VFRWSAGPLGLPVDQRLKLLSYLHIQLHDTLVGLALAAILGSDREATASALSRTASSLALGSIIMAMLRPL
jgi:hypothetical protein